MAVGALVVSGCSGPQIEKASQGSEQPDNAAGAEKAAATNSENNPEDADHGDVLGTFHLKVTSTEGYSATMKVVAHKPTMQPAPPEWCATRFNQGTREGDLSAATSVVLMSVESTIELDPHEGFAPPMGWAPFATISLPNIEQLVAPDGKKYTGYPGYGECYDLSAPHLTKTGLEANFIDLDYGRSIPTRPLPKTIEEIPWSDNRPVHMRIDDVGGECTMLPDDEFTDALPDRSDFNSPEKNNGDCDFAFTAKVTT